MVLSCLAGASLSKASLRADTFKANLCYGQPAVEPTPGFAWNRPFPIEIVLKVKQYPAPFQNRDSTGKPVLREGLSRQSCATRGRFRSPVAQSPLLQALVAQNPLLRSGRCPGCPSLALAAQNPPLKGTVAQHCLLKAYRSTALPLSGPS